MNDRLPYAPTFTRTHDDPVSLRFDDTPRCRPGPVPSRTLREARAKGLGAPEDPDWRGQ
jgi:hypothetical protein